MKMERRIWVGPAGWSYKDWEGAVYPSPSPRHFDPLEYLSRYFDLLEVNSTFYRPPSPAVASKWARRVAQNPDFLFTVKVWRAFTHERAHLKEKEVRLFREGIEPLAEAGRLGSLILQFPWSFKNTPPSRAFLELLLESFEGYPLVVEVRHASWDRPAFHRTLASRSVGFCNIDQPLFRGSLGPTSRATAPTGYVRLHGRNVRDWFRKEAGRDERYDYLYGEEELEGWKERILRVAEKSLRTFVVANNHYRGQAACNALELRSLLEGKRVSVPASLLAAYPRLVRVAAEGSVQGTLF